MRIFFRFFICLFIIGIGATQRTYAQTDYYRRHYVIVVDQGVIQGHPNTSQLYRDIKELFVDNKPLTEKYDQESLPNFKEDCDQISVFASGFPHNSQYREMFNKCRSGSYKDNEIVQVLVDNLFHRGVDFQSSNLELSQYLDKYLKPLMTCKWKNTHIIANNIERISGFNEYLYPLVLHKLDSDSKTPSERYYFIIISNFTSQGTVLVVHDQQVVPLLHEHRYVRSFDDNIQFWESYFYKNEYTNGYTTRYSASEPTGEPAHRNFINNNPRIKYFKLGVKALESVCVSIQSSPRFSQRELHGEAFDITNSAVVFNHPQSLKVTDAWMDVEVNGNHATTIKYTLGKDVKAVTQGDLLIYKFDEKKDVNLGSLQPNDVISTKYHFSSKIMERDNKSLLPMNFAAACSYTMDDKDFVPEPAVIPAWAKIMMWSIASLLLIGLLYYIWKKRGEVLDVKLTHRFMPVSREKYMDVSNMKVKEYDCWYMDAEAERTHTKLEVHGNISTLRKVFAQDLYRIRLEFKINDIDYDDNFTFRPRGSDDRGQRYEENKWYLVEVDKNTGNFNIPVIAYLDTEKNPELRNLDDSFWQEDHILRVQITFRAYLVDKHEKEILKAKVCDTVPGKDLWATNPQSIYEFIARPIFDLRDSWIAFDPGTSGACAAFITGGNISTPDNIHVVNESISGSLKGDAYAPVFPSKIWITNHARDFKKLNSGEEITDISSWEEAVDQRSHKDFIFGWYADRLVAPNIFQSIKKLLGYTNTQTIVNENGKELQISGKLLAQLLVKGLYERAKRYIMELYKNPAAFNGKIPHQPNPIDIENHYLDSNKELSPQKAIVAVPNNYTLPKIQDMVDTIKALGQFREVHYLYESEGVLMEYCHRNWQKLDTKSGKLLIVFDMGGATINATAFRFTEMKKDKLNNITNIALSTVGKIGYCVGGDDIDYAIIRQIYSMSPITALYESEDDIKSHMASHKQVLIKLARELKLAIIAKLNGKNSFLNNKEGFYNHIMSYAKNMQWPEELQFTPADYDIWMDPKKMCTSSKLLQSIVYEKVADSVRELYASMNPEHKNLPVELIFSGRSTLFPFIRETVQNSLPPSTTYEVWRGFEKDGVLDADAVKTAVATGACWYANFSQHITIKHNIITTAFGYLDHKDNEEIFIPMIKAGEEFTSEIITRNEHPNAPDLLQEITFVQMQGADHAKILKDFRSSSESKHKMNILDKVGVASVVNDIKITLDERFNFGYEVDTASDVEEITQDNYPLSRLRLGNAVKTEISDENNDSYMFAAISSREEIKSEQKLMQKRRF